MLMPDELTGGGGGGEEKALDSGAGEPQGLDTESTADLIGAELFSEPGREYNRDEKGKFAPKAEEPAPAADKGKVTPGPDNKVTEQLQPKPGDPAVPAPAPADGQPAPAPVQPERLQPPNTWSKDALPFWEQTPPRVQAEILKREQDMFRGLSQYKEAAQLGQSFSKTVEPFVPLFQKFQLNPSEVIKRAMTAHFNLTLSPPEVKVKLARTLLQDYGIDFESLLDDLPAPGEGPSPEVLQLRQELHNMRETLTGIQQRHAEQTRSAVAADVDAFAADPAHPYFDELSDDIAQLLQKRAATDLKDAYEKAIWLNPATRAKELARQAAATRDKTAQEEAERIAKAKQATAANVRVQARPAPALDQSPTGSMDDTLTETMNKIKARA